MKALVDAYLVEIEGDPDGARVQVLGGQTLRNSDVISTINGGQISFTGLTTLQYVIDTVHVTGLPHLAAKSHGRAVLLYLPVASASLELILTGVEQLICVVDHSLDYTEQTETVLRSTLSCEMSVRVVDGKISGPIKGDAAIFCSHLVPQARLGYCSFRLSAAAHSETLVEKLGMGGILSLRYAIFPFLRPHKAAKLCRSKKWSDDCGWLKRYP